MRSTLLHKYITRNKTTTPSTYDTCMYLGYPRWHCYVSRISEIGLVRYLGYPRLKYATISDIRDDIKQKFTLQAIHAHIQLTQKNYTLVTSSSSSDASVCKIRLILGLFYKRQFVSFMSFIKDIPRKAKNPPHVAGFLLS